MDVKTLSIAFLKINTGRLSSETMPKLLFFIKLLEEGRGLNNRKCRKRGGLINEDMNH